LNSIYKAFWSIKSDIKMSDILIKELQYELEDIRKSFFKRFIILSTLISIVLGTITVIIFYFLLNFQKRVIINQELLNLFYILLIVLIPGVGIYILYKISKDFSFIAKEKIFDFIKKLEGIEIISYQQESKDLKNVAKKMYKNFNAYWQGYSFAINLHGKYIKICELTLKHITLEKRKDYIIFQGIVISIPTIYVKNDIKKYQIVKDSNYTYIFIPKAKDMSELTILKSIKQQDIEKIIKQLRNYVNTASKLIKN